MADMLRTVEVGDQTYTQDGADPFGAVRQVRANELLVYDENAGDQIVPRAAVKAVHSGKVIVDVRHVGRELQELIRHAHDREEPGV